MATLMHASLTASTLFMLAPSAQGASLVLYYLILAAALWIIVGAVIVANRRLPENSGAYIHRIAA